MRRRGRWGWLAAGPMLLLAAGCNDELTGPAGDEAHDLRPGHALLTGEADVELDVEGAPFGPGGEAILVLRNHSDEQIGYNLCFHALEVQESGEWQTVEPHEEWVCLTVLHLLDPGGTAQFVTTLPESLAPGQYRFRVALWLPDRDEHRDQVSAPFELDA